MISLPLTKEGGLKKGNEGLVGLLVDRYLEVIFSNVNAIVFDTKATETITEETFVFALKSERGLQPSKRLEEYLIKLSVHLTGEYLKKERVEHIFEPWHTHEKADELLGERRPFLANRAKEAFRLLSPHQNQIVGLRIFKGLSFDEIASLVQMDVSETKREFHLALKRLVRYLANVNSKS